MATEQRSADRQCSNLGNDLLTEDGTPHANDVLCGRGGGTTKHAGNIQWRALVAANKELYKRFPKRQKTIVSRSIVNAIRSQDPAGRFLQKDIGSTWFDIGDQKATEKTSQVFREVKKNISELSDNLLELDGGPGSGAHHRPVNEEYEKMKEMFTTSNKGSISTGKTDNYITSDNDFDRHIDMVSPVEQPDTGVHSFGSMQSMSTSERKHLEHSGTFLGDMSNCSMHRSEPDPIRHESQQQMYEQQISPSAPGMHPPGLQGVQKSRNSLLSHSETDDGSGPEAQHPQGNEDYERMKEILNISTKGESVSTEKRDNITHNNTTPLISTSAHMLPHLRVTSNEFIRNTSDVSTISTTPLEPGHLSGTFSGMLLGRGESDTIEMTN